MTLIGYTMMCEQAGPIPSLGSTKTVDESPGSAASCQ